MCNLLNSITMNRFFKYIFSVAIAVIAMSFAACSPDSVTEPNEGGVPKADDIDVNVLVDQTTNEVTFTLNNKQCSPIWIFSDGKKSTINDYTKIYTVAGTYEVEVKMYNSNGICDGNKKVSFTINNSIVDFTPYMTRLCGTDGTKTWQIAADKDGHLSCGPSGTDGTEWYSAKANEKAGFGLYENRFIFATNGGTSTGAYTFDPGTSGTVYVNIGCTNTDLTSKKPADATADYPISADKQDATFAFGVTGSDMYLTLPAKTFLGYVPNDDAYNKPSFRIVSLKENQMDLVIDNGTIAWHYILEPVAKVMTNEEKLAGTDAAGKTWYWDQNGSGHLGCGPSGGNGLEWYSANANDKASVGLYKQSFVFAPDGTYTFNPGENGLYVNHGVTISDFTSSSTYDANTDYSFAMSAQKSTWKFEEADGNLYLTLPKATYLGYLANDNMYNNPKFRVVSINSDTINLINDDGTIAWHYRLVTSIGEKPKVFDEGEALTPAEYAKGLIGTWTWESTTPGHFGCGESTSNATGWWSAAANDKAGWGLYDDMLTFNADGSYVFDPGEGGTVYMNHGVTVADLVARAVEGADKTQDYQITASKQTTTYTLATGDDGNYYISFPAQTIVSYISSDDFFATPRVMITKMTTNVLEFNSVQNGISWHYRLMRVTQ
jgi:hypothetical protein